MLLIILYDELLPETNEALNFIRERSEYCNRPQIDGFYNYKTSPAGSNIKEIPNHLQSGHLASTRRKLVINVDSLQRLRARYELAAVKLGADSLVLGIPLVYNTTWIQVAEDMLACLSRFHLHHLSNVQGVVDNILVGYNAVL